MINLLSHARSGHESSASMTEILASFTALLQAEVQANLFVSVVAQSFAQIFYFINSYVCHCHPLGAINASPMQINI